MHVRSMYVHRVVDMCAVVFSSVDALSFTARFRLRTSQTSNLGVVHRILGFIAIASSSIPCIS